MPGAWWLIGARSRLLAACLLLLGYHNLSALSVSLDTAQERLRPGGQVSVNYTLIGYTGDHHISLATIPSGLAVSPTTGTGDRGTFIVSANGTVGAMTTNLVCTITSAMDATNSGTAPLRIITDPPPTLTPGQTFTLIEDQSGRIPISFFDNNVPDLTVDAVLGGDILMDGSASNGTALGEFSIPLLPRANLYGTVTALVRVSDRTGLTDLPITIDITNTNDPPVALLTPVADAVMDPGSGMPVAVASLLRIDAGVDPSVTKTVTDAAGTRTIGFRAEVDGEDGLDLLCLRGDATHTIEDGKINLMPDNVIIARWSVIGTRRLDVTLEPTATFLQQRPLISLLRYAHLANPAAELQRTITITVSEPDPGGGFLESPPVTCTCRVLPVDAPPSAALQPLEVVPLGSGALVLHLSDRGGLAGINVRAIDPLPVGGHLEPAACNGLVATSGGLRYVHTDPTIHEDRITLAIDDGHNPAVLVTGLVTVRERPDRVSIVSDPLLEVVRGRSSVHAITTVPADASLRLADYGAPLPALPAGVALTDGRLSFDWKAIPARIAWIALTVEASITATDIPADRATTRQPMLIRIRDPDDVGEPD